MEYSDEDSYTFPGNRKSMTSYLDEYFKSLKRFTRIEEKFITVFTLTMLREKNMFKCLRSKHAEQMYVVHLNSIEKNKSEYMDIHD